MEGEKKRCSAHRQECSLFIKGTLEAESISDTILAKRSRKTKASKGLAADVSQSSSLKSPDCPYLDQCLLTAAVPQKIDCARAQNGYCWQQTTSGRHCLLPRALFHSCGLAPPCEMTRLPPVGSIASDV